MQCIFRGYSRWCRSTGWSQMLPLSSPCLPSRHRCSAAAAAASVCNAVPIVRSTGGLADTVFDVDSAPPEQANGYSFGGADEASLNSALDRALTTFKEKPEAWKQLSRSNMQRDVSWAQSAKSYVEAYRSISQL